MNTKIIVPIIIVLTLIASASGVMSLGDYGGVFYENIYGIMIELYNNGIYDLDSVSIAFQAIGQDIVTLCVVLPIYIYSYMRYRKIKSLKMHLLFLGLTGYLMYTYLTYALISYINELFLVYTSISALCFFVFVYGLIDLSKKDIGDAYKNIPVKITRIYILVMTFVIALLWLGMIRPVFTGDMPSSIDHYNSLPIQVLDFVFLIPISLHIATKLGKHKPIFLSLAFVFLIKLSFLFISITAMLIMMNIGGVQTSIVEFILFPLFGVVSSVVVILYFKRIKDSRLKI